MKCVNQGLKVRLYPDEDMMIKINQNIGNSRFTWNKLLEYYKETYKLFKLHGYSKLKCNMTTFNAMLNMLKKEHDFLYLSESSSLQQVYRDLIHAYNKFFIVFIFSPVSSHSDRTSDEGRIPPPAYNLASVERISMHRRFT